MVDKKMIFFVFFFGIFLINLTSASFNVGNPASSLTNIYGPSNNINGWINISFNSEPLNSLFSDSRGNSINISNILKNNFGYSYSCSPVDCSSGYNASNGMQTKIATLNPGDSKIYGLRLTGNIFRINSLNFTLDSTATPSCMNQIGVDFLDDGSIDVVNNKSLDSATCSNLRDYGCFDLSASAAEPVMGSTPYCELVNLSASPGFNIGAWVKKVNGLETIAAVIYKTNGQEVARCKLPDANTSGGEVSCSVNYSLINPEKHYVCIYSTGGSGDYRAKGYSPQSNGCGFHGTPIPSLSPAAYQIFAQGKSFDAMGSINVSNSMIDGTSLAQLAENYIRVKYGTMNCSSGCVIPISINSNSNQSITLRNLQAQYENDIGVVVENNFYDVSKTPAKASSDFQKLYLDSAGFSVPSTIGNYSFLLNLNSQNVISNNLQVIDIPIINSLSPQKTASAYPTNFNVNVHSNYNLTGFSWDFGDNTSAITQSNNVTHTYTITGAYNLSVTVIDQRGLNSSKVFLINVSSPKDLINSKLNDIKKSILNLGIQISSFDSFSQQALSSSLNISYLNQTVNLLNAQYQTATSDSDYNLIVNGLLQIKIPDSVSQTGGAGNITFLSKPSDINLKVLQDIGGGTFDSNNQKGYINVVLLWQNQNLQTKMDFSQFSGTYSGYTQFISSIFKMNIVQKKDVPYDYYLIIPQFAGFQTDAQYTNKSGYVYINLKNKNSISFSTTENVDFTTLPAFIAPAISKLSVTQTLPEQATTSKWTVFALVILFLLVLAFVIYLIMQEWYKRRYENYLFKNRNDLYNMVNYVNNAKKKGLKNSEIEENLKKAGWNSERIRYVMKKYSGKRTGMFEIVPITKFGERTGTEGKGK